MPATNGFRTNSTSPPGSGEGGVTLPRNANLQHDEPAAQNGHSYPRNSNLQYDEPAAQNGHSYSPYAGVPQYNGFAHRATNGVNGNSSHTNGNGLKLNGHANEFRPNGAKGTQAPIGLRLLALGSTPDTDGPTIVTSPNPAAGPISAVSPGDTKCPQLPIGTIIDGKFVPQGPKVQFTTDFGPDVKFKGGHYVKIFNIATRELETSFKVMLDDFEWESKILEYKVKFSSDGQQVTYYICFDDIHAAGIAREEMEMMGTSWELEYIHQPEFAAVANAKSNVVDSKSTFHDGQLIFVATFNGPTADFKTDGAYEAVHTLAQKEGKVMAFVPDKRAMMPNLEFRVEFSSIAVARKLLEEMKTTPRVTGNWHVTTKALENSTPASPASGLRGAMTEYSVTDTPQKVIDGDETKFASPTGRTAWKVDENGQYIPSEPLRVVPKTGPIPFGMPIVEYCNSPHRSGAGRYPSAPTPYTPSHMMDGVNMPDRSASYPGYDNGSYGYNYYSPRPRSPIPPTQAIDVVKIRKGNDVRTTVMLRNIPNRMTIHEFKKVLNKHNFGRYDFAYLRIDFCKGTNVGYAFVNFCKPEDIAHFVDMWNGNPWVPGNKRCVELSYATVQGIDCLIEKFRNSAIMSEFPDYRPKLFQTEANASALRQAPIGEEIPFPPPNNLSKKQRSHDNAGTIGLYGPRSGPMSRDRGRHSQYDRGTPAQLREDAYYHASPIQHGYNYGPAGYGRMPMGPPPPFPQMGYVNGYGTPYMGGNFNPAYGYGNQHAVDPFTYENGYNNGYGRGAQHGGFGTGPYTPASRRRHLTNGRLGRGNVQVTTLERPIEGPGPDNHMGYIPELAEQLPEGVNFAEGPFYCPE